MLCVLQNPTDFSRGRMSVKAIKNKDWNTIASIYNGSGYLALAKKLGREPYNITMAKNYKKLKPMFE